MQITIGAAYIHRADEGIFFIPITAHKGGFFGEFVHGQNAWVSQEDLDLNYLPSLSAPDGWIEDGQELVWNDTDCTLRIGDDMVWFIHRGTMTAIEISYEELLECIKFVQAKVEA